MLWMFFGRTDLILGASKAKYCEELDFETCFYITPQIPQKSRKTDFRDRKISNFVFRYRKITCWGSSETRFGKVWWSYGPCLRGKRPFEVSRVRTYVRTYEIALTSVVSWGLKIFLRIRRRTGLKIFVRIGRRTGL